MTTTVHRFFLAALLFFVLSPLVWAEDTETATMTEEMKKYRFETVTTKEGFKFSIPSDMPIERKDGLVTPIPFDEYLYIKFKMIEERIGKMEKRLDQMEANILSKLTEIKAQDAEISKKLSTLAVPAAEPQPAS